MFGSTSTDSNAYTTFTENGESDKKSKYSDLYKNRSKTLECSQRERREQFLESQKELRSSFIDEKRKIFDLFKEVEDEEVNEFVPNKSYSNKRLDFKLMMSEWFTDIPEDLAENWLVKFCPNGRRRLIIAHKGSTKCFNKRAKKAFTFKSNLPGGGKSNGNKLTVFDCIFHQESSTFYILDLLVWNSVPFIDCEAHLRHFILQSKFEEEPYSFQACGNFPYCFEFLECFDATTETIQKRMHESFDKPLDGIIFYHKEAGYTQGSTPLVTWLKPYMLPEKLGVEVPMMFIEKRPKHYVNMEEFLKFKSSRKKNKFDNEMITDDETTEDSAMEESIEN